MPRFNLAEEGHFVSLFTPAADGSAASSEVLSMENFSHATIVAVSGAGGSGYTIVAKEATSFAAAGGRTFLPYKYAREQTASGDTLDAALAAGATTGVVTGTGANIFTIIEVEASALSDGYPYLYITNDGAGTGVLCAFAILSGNRYAQSIVATAIA